MTIPSTLTNPPTTSLVIFEDTVARAHWAPIAVDLNQTSYVWDTSYLEKGPDYFVKIVATDGVNTGEDIFKQRIHG